MIPAPHVLLWGLASDAPTSQVRDALERTGCPFTFLDQRSTAETQIDLVVDSAITGQLRVGPTTIDLSAITAAYIRPYNACDLPLIAAAGPESDLFRHAALLDDTLLSWADLTPALVLNRPDAMSSNNSKPFQSTLIQSFGFRVPDTLITTDPDRALAFWRTHEHVIYKSISGTRSIVSRLTAAHLDRLADIASCPTQLQQYIPGLEYRVHVVGSELFACSIRSTADDYRYAALPAQIEPCTLPPEVAQSCIALAHTLHLPLAGLDLRCTPQGDWFCFEVNPSPGFTSFTHLTGHPIADSIALLLASA